MNKVCFVVPYFGKLPAYFDLWLASCRQNEQFDFLLISDNDLSAARARNIMFVRTSFAELRHSIQMLFDFPIHLESPYKLCDYRPAYGIIFQEYLHSYEYWGHIDTDIIAGNLKTFYSNNVLNNYDKVSTWGHLTIYRNTSKMNNLFRKGEFKKAFSTNYSIHYDEWGGVSQLAVEQGIRQYDGWDMADINASKFRFAHASSIGHLPQIFEYNNGVLQCLYLENDEIKAKECGYIHLQKRPMANNITRDSNHYLIIPNQFIDYQEDEIYPLLQEQRKKQFYWYWYKVRIKMIVKNIRDGAILHRVGRIIERWK